MWAGELALRENIFLFTQSELLRLGIKNTIKYHHGLLDSEYFDNLVRSMSKRIKAAIDAKE